MVVDPEVKVMRRAVPLIHINWTSLFSTTCLAATSCRPFKGR